MPQTSLGMFASTMQTYRERLQEAARELSSQYDQIKPEAEGYWWTDMGLLSGLSWGRAEALWAEREWLAEMMA